MRFAIPTNLNWSLSVASSVIPAGVMHPVSQVTSFPQSGELYQVSVITIYIVTAGLGAAFAGHDGMSRSQRELVLVAAGKCNLRLPCRG